MTIIRTYVSDKTDSRRKHAQAMDEAEQNAVRMAKAIALDPALLLGLSLKLIETVCSNMEARKIIEPAVVKMAKKCPHTYKVFASASMR